MIEKNKYEKIIDIFNWPYGNKDVKPNIYRRDIFADKALVLLDTPHKEDAYHGSSFEFRCSRYICRISGEIVTKRELEKDLSDKIIENGRAIRKIHRHPESILATVPGKQYKKGELESHIHFTCLNKDYNVTIKIANFLKDY
jgi:hypothetical protein